VAKLEGVKIQISGRLNGAEIVLNGSKSVYRFTLRADIDYSSKVQNNLWYSRDQSLDFQR
jgi:ribosomal protein S3